MNDICLKDTLNLQNRPDLTAFLWDDSEANLIVAEFAPCDLANRAERSTELWFVSGTSVTERENGTY